MIIKEIIKIQSPSWLSMEVENISIYYSFNYDYIPNPRLLYIYFTKSKKISYGIWGEDSMGQGRSLASSNHMEAYGHMGLHMGWRGCEWLVHVTVMDGMIWLEYLDGRKAA